jgi:hypothetical protein
VGPSLSNEAMDVRMTIANKTVQYRNFGWFSRLSNLVQGWKLQIADLV